MSARCKHAHLRSPSPASGACGLPLALRPNLRVFVARQPFARSSVDVVSEGSEVLDEDCREVLVELDSHHTDGALGIGKCSCADDAANATAARRCLVAYNRHFPEAQLAPDADALAIEAPAEQGSRAEAARRSARFLSQYPKDPHAARVQLLSGR
jgi:hypothetical protein